MSFFDQLSKAVPTPSDAWSTTDVLLHGILSLLANSSVLVVPNYTTAQRDAIPSPTNGMLITNTDTNTLEQYLNGAWQAFLING